MTEPKIITDTFSVLVSEIKHWKIANASYCNTLDKHFETRLIIQYGEYGHDVLEGECAAEFYDQLCEHGWASPGTNIFRKANEIVKKIVETVND